MTDQSITDFRETVWEYYRQNARSMPWRGDTRPYYVLVSELMLQQTQVDRVVPKFEAFIATFPDVAVLARAELAEVLKLWNGLGYNRRAKFLWQAAQMVERECAGIMPDTAEYLQKLPGVGPNTAGAIMAYAYNQPIVFIETNVRTVLFHHFFTHQPDQVSDAELREVAERVMDREHTREWYWALMDYGTHLKKTAGGRLSQSKHYKKQPPLKGSLREMRGRIIRALTKEPLATDALREQVIADERFDLALTALMDEGMVRESHGILML